MSAIAEITGNDVRATFKAPFNLDGHALFLKSKKLPEARCDFDRLTDSYTITAPARFAHLLGLEPKQQEQSTMGLSPFLFDYQSWLVGLALEAKRYAVWADCGLGKTPMELEFARHVNDRTKGRVLIFTPKQIIGQTMDESRKFYGDTMPLLRLETRDDLIKWAKDGTEPYGITNYEKLIPGVIDELRYCGGIVADESSILKGGGGKIKWNLIKSCRGIEYKWSGTATPAPNDVIEYASQASFLEKLRNEGEIMWTFFHRDPKTQDWKVRPHAKDAFYRWMSAWSIYLRCPSAYGFKKQFDLPEPEIKEIPVAATSEQMDEAKKWIRNDGELIPRERLGVKERTKLSQIAKGFIYEGEGKGRKARRIQSQKPETVAALIERGLREGRHPLCWTVFDSESEIIMETLGNDRVVALHGKDCEEARDEKLEAYRTGQIDALVSKAELLGFGMNFPFCSWMVFSGFDDSFESFYQAVRRAHRYGATQQLQVFVPYIRELESHMWNNLIRKRNQWEGDITTQEANYAKAMKGLKA